MGRTRIFWGKRRAVGGRCGDTVAFIHKPGREVYIVRVIELIAVIVRPVFIAPPVILCIHRNSAAVEEPVGLVPQKVVAADKMLRIVSDVNTVEISDNVNTALAADGSVTLGQGDTIQLIWDSGDSIWYEVSRSNN